MPRSSTAPGKATSELAIVATLACIALCSYLLRLFMHGRRPRTFAFDDGLAMAAALCTTASLVAWVCLCRSGVEEPQWQGPAEATGPWILVLDVCHVMGMGFVKLSAAFYLLRIFDWRYCRYLLYGLIAILVPSVLVWLGSMLLVCVPVTAAWDMSPSPEAHCMSWEASTIFDAVNNVINTSTDIILILLVFPIARRSSLRPWHRVAMLSIVGIGLLACTAAIIQTQKLFASWMYANTKNSHTSAIHLWSTIELCAALTATNLATLRPLLYALPFTSVPKPRLPNHHHHHHPVPSAPLPQLPQLPPPSFYLPPHSRSSSSHTVIHRPPNSTRFHDIESNLDFDMATVASRTRTHTMQSQATTALPSLALHTTPHSRNVSDWSQFSGFTDTTDGMESGALERAGEVGNGNEDEDEDEDEEVDGGSVCAGEVEMEYGRTR